MADITWPAAIKVLNCVPGVTKPGVQFRSPFTGGLQATGFSGQRLTMSLTLRTVHRTAEPKLPGLIESLLFYLAGGVNRVALYHFARPVPVGTARGTPTLSATVNRGDTVLPITGATASGTYEPGDMLGVGGYLFMVGGTSTFTLNGSGAGNVPIVNAVRATIASASAVTWNQPTAYFVMPATTQAVTHVPVVMQGAALDLEES